MQIHANESGHGCTEAVPPSGGPPKTGSTLNIDVYLRSSAADCFFQDQTPRTGGKTMTQAIDIGISNDDRAVIAQGLSRLLADSYTLYLKTHNFHWNVTGPMFNTLHLMLETQYNEMALAVDLIAERIRALGYPAPGTYAEVAKLSSTKDAQGVPKAEDMNRRTGDGR